MSEDKAEAIGNTDLANKIDEHLIERSANDVLARAKSSTVRPWTADFLLPSIRFREPSAKVT